MRKDAQDIDDPKKKRLDVCRLCNYDGLTVDQKHLILREAYRNYLTWEYLMNTEETVGDVIEYSIPASDEDREAWIPISISFTDLSRALKTLDNKVQIEGTILSKRKEQAFYLNVIRDMKQKDVADLMNITTVSVGQYVDQAVLQLSEYYFREMNESEITEDTYQEDTD